MKRNVIIFQNNKICMLKKNKNKM